MSRGSLTGFTLPAAGAAATPVLVYADAEVVAAAVATGADLSELVEEVSRTNSNNSSLI